MCISAVHLTGLGEADAAEQKQKCFEPFDVHSAVIQSDGMISVNIAKKCKSWQGAQDRKYT